MVRATTNTEATYEDLAALPDTVVGEIIDGELHVSPRLALPHAHASSALMMLLGPAFHLGHGGPGGWSILFEPELHLSRDVVVPDLAGWHKARLPTIPNEPWTALPPDWVCEVLSPSTARIDRTKKLALYAREKVQHVWLVDPIAKTVEVFERNGDLWTLLGVAGDKPAALAPFDAIELPVTALWDEAE